MSSLPNTLSEMQLTKRILKVAKQHGLSCAVRVGCTVKGVEKTRCVWAHVQFKVSLLVSLAFAMYIVTNSDSQNFTDAAFAAELFHGQSIHNSQSRVVRAELRTGHILFVERIDGWRPDFLDVVESVVEWELARDIELIGRVTPPQALALAFHTEAARMQCWRRLTHFPRGTTIQCGPYILF